MRYIHSWDVDWQKAVKGSAQAGTLVASWQIPAPVQLIGGPICGLWMAPAQCRRESKKGALMSKLMKRQLAIAGLGIYSRVLSFSLSLLHVTRTTKSNVCEDCVRSPLFANGDDEKIRRGLE